MQPAEDLEINPNIDIASLKTLRLLKIMLRLSDIAFQRVRFSQLF